MGDAASVITALGPFLGSGGGAFALVFMVYTLRQSKRSDDRKDDVTERQAYTGLIATLRQQLDSANRDLDGLRRSLKVLEADRDRGWDTARWWNTKAHDLWTQLRDLVLATPPQGLTMPAVLPGFEEPCPKR